MAAEPEAAYDEFAAAYAEHAAASAFNAFYDRPAILALAGDVRGQRVLDVGCAAGHLSERLHGAGASVTAMDLSAELIDVARSRCPEVSFRVADLAAPLDFLADGEVDLITASLVLHYLRDWGPTLAEFRRVLRPGGLLVLSVHHPEDWHWFDGTDYFRTELVTDEWQVAGRPTTVRFYRRPLHATFNALRDAGFQIDRMDEPMPLPACRSADPRAFEVLTTAPRFLYIRAVSPP